jgi:hypothetical protein
VLTAIGERHTRRRKLLLPPFRLRAIATHTGLAAPDPTPERARRRDVTMIPDRGRRVLVVSKRRRRPLRSLP